MRRKVNGEEIRRRRKRLGLTQEKLAEVAELNVRTIRRAEEGRSMSARTLDRIAQGLGAQAEALVYVEHVVKAPVSSERPNVGSTAACGQPSANAGTIPSWANLGQLPGLALAEEAYRLHTEPLRHIQDLYANLPGVREAQLLAERAAEPLRRFQDLYENLPGIREAQLLAERAVEPVIRMQKEYDALVAPLLEQQRRLTELCSVFNPIGGLRLV